MEDFLRLLGFDLSGEISTRAFYPKTDKRAKDKTTAKHLTRFWQVCQVQMTNRNKRGQSIYLVINGPGLEDADIKLCRAIFYEHDTIGKDASTTLWQHLGLPRPSFQVDTGGKSIHSYWVLTEPVTPDKWKPLQADLIEFADADRQCKNPSRVMRCPGFAHPETGQMATLINATEQRYSFDELRAIVPVVERQAPRPPVEAMPSSNGHSSNGATSLGKMIAVKLRPLLEGAQDGSRNGDLYRLGMDLAGVEQWMVGNGYQLDDRAWDLFYGACLRSNPPMGSKPDDPQPEEMWARILRDCNGPSLSDDKLRNIVERKTGMSDRNGHGGSGDESLESEFDVPMDNETILSLEYEIIELKENLAKVKPRSIESTTVNREIDAKERKLKVMKQQAKLLERKDEEEKTAFECDLEAIELFADRLRLNILTGEIEFDNKPLPGAGIRSFLAKKTGHRGWKTSDNSVWEICEDMASDNQYCPVQEYLDGLDAGLFEEGFLETLALKLYGTTDNLQAEYLKLTLIGSVARAYNRGAHHPSMLILYSQKHQVGKSSSIRTLYGKEFSGEGLLQMDNKDGQISMKNCWAYELAEVNKIFNTKDAETMKSFITLETDLYREHYGRKNKRVPRFSILWGTTNQPEFFTDETGNVRYFVIELKDDHMLDLEWLKNNRDKIWTCAKELYLRGESNLLAFNKREEQEKQNKERMTRDPWEEIIEEYLAKHNVPFITCTKLLLNCLDCYTKDITRADSNRVGRILRKLGYTLSEKTERDLTDGGKVGKQWKKLEPAPTKENKEF